MTFSASKSGERVNLPLFVGMKYQRRKNKDLQSEVCGLICLIIIPAFRSIVLKKVKRSEPLIHKASDLFLKFAV